MRTLPSVGPGFPVPDFQKTGFTSMTGRGPRSFSYGFTLLEMIISLTILSLVILTVYVAFSLGVDVWQDMGDKKTAVDRKAIAIRLLKQDFSSIRPYTWNSEDGQLMFFAGGPRCVFYVTTNGLGAKNRSGKALFFTCLYIDAAPEDEEGNSLYVYKSGLPGPDFLETLREFRTGSDMFRSNFVPPTFVSEDSIPVLNNISDAQFGYQERAYPPFSGAKTEMEGEWGQQKGSGEVLAETEWVQNKLPGQISFMTQYVEEEFMVRAVLSNSPPLDHAKR